MTSVIINGRFLTQRITGVNRFALEICNSLRRLSFEFKVIVPEWYEDIHNSGIELVRYGNLRSHFWEQIDLPRFLKKNGSPLLVNFAGLGPVFYENQILTIHDLSFLRNRKWFSFSYFLLYSFLTPIAARRAKLIITVSNFSKNEIAELLRIEKDKIWVIPNAVSGQFVSSAPAERKQKYILAVSSLDPRKNHGRLIRAFNLAGLQGYQLLLVGKYEKHFGSSVKSFFDNKTVSFLGYVSDEELVKLYQNASLFVYPSLYEGFGIPPLEAMALGCPVIASSIPSLREVLGDSVFYVDPYDENDIASGISTLLNDTWLTSQLIDKGYLMANKYSWEESAKKVINLIEHVILNR